MRTVFLLSILALGCGTPQLKAPVEVCDNDTDDDGDGKTDCADPACFSFAQCCLDLCGEGTTLCEGSGFRVCTMNGKTQCREPGPLEACSEGLVCSGGTCVKTCSNQCVLGTQQCSGTNGLVACTTLPSGCTDWTLVQGGTCGCTPFTAVEACQGLTCGNVTRANGCGAMQTYSCGPACPVPDAGACVPETNTALCSTAGYACGTLGVFDRCGVKRLVDCGGCPNGQSCLSDDFSSACAACAAEDDLTLCNRQGLSCGAGSAVDACGTTRTLDCGACPDAGGSCQPLLGGCTATAQCCGAASCGAAGLCCLAQASACSDDADCCAGSCTFSADGGAVCSTAPQIP